MTELSLDCTPRTVYGKSPMRKLRREGVIPAVIYGLNDPISVQLDGRLLSRLVDQMRGAERMISLNINGGSGMNVLIKEVQTTPVGQTILHVDFQEIDTSKTVQVSVELRPVGASVGVKLGGVLQAVKHDILVECLPIAIPEFIEADVTALEIGHSLHVSDLIFPAGIKPITDAAETLIVISAPRVEEEIVEEVVEGEAGEPVEGEAEGTPEETSDSDQK